MPGPAYVAIYDLAERQHGVFDTEQAQQCGVSAQALGMMERRGMLDRVSHGVYSLVLFPARPESRAMCAVLWPHRTGSVLALDSALWLHGLTPEPEVLDVCVPRSYRTRRAVPEDVRLHKGELSESDRGVVSGVPVTTLERTLLDLKVAGRDQDELDDLIEQARKKRQMTWMESFRIRDRLITL